MRNKTKKYRGSKTHGYGSKKKHRGKGSKGGRGRAGHEDHKKFMYLKIEKKIKKKQKLREKDRSIMNIYELSKINEKEVDLRKFGIKKLLGSGEIKDAKIVYVSKCSKKAREKIELAGGKVILCS